MTRGMRVTIQRPDKPEAFTTVPTPTYDEAVERALLSLLQRLDPTVLQVKVNPAITRARILHDGGSCVEAPLTLERTHA